jgi:hypothetical protein
MDQFQIFWPMLVQVALSAAILFWLAWSRVSRIAKQGIGEIRKSGFPTHVNNASDNFKNQFEVPVLFYALCVFFVVTDGVTQTVLISAWVFVVARLLHALIQLTKNVIFPYRFGAFLISALAVVVMTVLAFRHLALL